MTLLRALTVSTVTCVFLFSYSLVYVGYQCIRLRKRPKDMEKLRDRRFRGILAASLTAIASIVLVIELHLMTVETLLKAAITALQ